METADIERLSGVHGAVQNSACGSAERTESYVRDQSAYMDKYQPTADGDNPQPGTEVKVDSKPRDDSPPEHKPVRKGDTQQLFRHGPAATEATSGQRHLLVYFTPRTESEQNTPQFKSLCLSPKDNTKDKEQSLRGGDNVSGGSRYDASDLGRFLARRDLLTAGLTKFNDKPEDYWAWRSTFSNAIEDLN
ncbi:hypothetical protein JOB18_021000 [Solea senegalensis]|uniref:Uncharacterized protein n=1 Tax=Solea senegalensis TaxID=28829 RepID=A0AAV6Q1Z4_SOLSE|nr:hypothetical protein JOB18_021000 [Solea senegalensis]